MGSNHVSCPVCDSLMIPAFDGHYCPVCNITLNSPKARTISQNTLELVTEKKLTIQ